MLQQNRKEVKKPSSVSLSMRKLPITFMIACLFKISNCEVIIETTHGPIRSTAALSDDVEAFLGVPFAEPPVGDLRFSRPVPKRPWQEIYNASSLPPACLQHPLPIDYYFMGDLSNMSEDCLYLNIWMPKRKLTKDLRPVIINIYYGAFSHGASRWKVFDGSHLASLGDVVVVTINYRVGSFGFFLALIEEANGNMGMYDQIMAMQWVKDNAKRFGGDPENIVLMGASAGALSIGVHLVSPLSQNLFRRGIMTSGSIIQPLFSDGNKLLLENCERIAAIAGCTDENSTLRSDPRAVVKCLKGKPKEVLLDADFALEQTSLVVFLPRSGDELLPKDAVLMFREGRFRRDVDVMCGTGENEGGILLVGYTRDYVGDYGQFPLTTLSKSKAIMLGRYVANLGKIKNVNDIVDFYMNRVEGDNPMEYFKALATAVGDYATACGSVFQSDFLSLKGNRVYYYKNGFRAASTPMAEWVGPTHVDDVQYIFGNPYHQNFTTEEVELSNRLIARISSFARTGNPDIPGQMPWPLYSYHDPHYLFIGQDEESVRIRPYDRCKIWRQRFKTEIDSDLVQFLQNPGSN